MLLNVLSEVDISKLNEAMFMMIIDNCWWLEMMIIWLWICLNEEYMYMYIWLDYMMIDYGEGYYLVIDNNNLCT